MTNARSLLTSIMFLVILASNGACTIVNGYKRAHTINHSELSLKSVDSFTFEGEIESGETFVKPLPGGLIFRLTPDQYAESGSIGWQISIVSSLGDNLNYAAVVTPPYRGVNELQIYGWHFRNSDNSGSNDGTTNAPQETRQFNFVLTHEDYINALGALECVLWSTQCREMSVSEAIETHQSVPIQRGTLVIHELETTFSNELVATGIASMLFNVELEMVNGGK